MAAPRAVLLGVNIDHVATLRQARREAFPDPVKAALIASENGADSITAHLREDRRHIQDDDLFRLKDKLRVPLNMEMAATPEIIAVAERLKSAWACLVPEKRQELTTEGGLSLDHNVDQLKSAVERLHKSGTKVSFFIEADPVTVTRAKELGADAVEIHTGPYAREWAKGGEARKKEIVRVKAAAEQASKLGLRVHAGHGLSYENVGDLAATFPFHEFNIGFSIVAHAVMIGIGRAVREMKEKMKIVCAES